MQDATELSPDLRQALNGFDRDATATITPFVEAIEKRPLPPMLHHYTNAAGLGGILETGTLRFSDIFSQNDPSELRHALRTAVDLLKSRIAAKRGEIELFAKQVERFDLDGGIEQAAYFFICCFSANGDDLGQWRAYADNGRGFALGFGTAELEEAFVKKDGQPVKEHSTFPVTYDDNEMKRIQEVFADLLDPLLNLPRITRTRGAELRDYMGDVLVSYAVHVVRSAMFFKHEGYRHESEYRFQQVFRRDLPPPDVKYRERGGSKIAFREFDWGTIVPGALRRITIGPSAVEVDARQFAEACLASRPISLGPVEIVRSTIPYRA